MATPMRLSLSTNWCNRRFESGEEIADTALALGFDELELGFHTTTAQVPGFRRRLDRMPVGSVHAFCPVPISAPQGYPELYPLASFDEEAGRMGLFQVRRNLAFAAEMGADAVVLHAGRVMCASRFARWRERRRLKRGRRLLEVLHRQLDALAPDLEKTGVTLALENLPYYEGFPNEDELREVLSWGFGERVRGWYDTGHARVRACNGWCPAEPPTVPAEGPAAFVGLHLNDVVDTNDDHLAPSFGKVDFAALRPLARAARHVVFEPNAGVSEEDLKTGIAYIRGLWETETREEPS